MAGRPRAARYAALAALNLALAAAIAAVAPAEPLRSDREAYEYAGRAPFAPECPYSIYCYRVLVPAALSRLPLDADTAWRAYQVGSNAAAGTVLAAVCGSLAGGAAAPVLATVMAQTSYGFTFTAYDPFTADPLVFLIAALMAWAWLVNRPWPVVALAVVGLFAKETVVVLAGGLALAAALDRRAGWRRWLAPALASGLVLTAFHVMSRTWLHWEIDSNPASQWSHGSWLGLWWRNNPFLERKAYMLFATFGFGWLLAAVGWRAVPPAWRALAAGTALPVLMLAIVQTPERALGNAFFIVVPMAVVAASQAPVMVAGAAITLNGMLTAKAGLSTAWLPSSRWLLVPATMAAIAVLRRGGTARHP